MKKIHFIFMAIFLFSCTNNRNNSIEQLDEPIEIVEKEKVIVPLSKLNALLLLPQDSIIEHLDLSNDSINFFPNLSSRTIKSLDLSHNQIDTFIIGFLPKGIERLNLSFNLLRHFDIGGLRVRDRNRVSALTELNLSNNNLTGWFTATQAPIRKLNLSHNDLTGVFFTCFICARENSGIWRVNYFNISHNPRLSSVLDLPYIVVDTLIRNDIADNDWITLLPPPPPPPPPRPPRGIILETVLLEADKDKNLNCNLKNDFPEK